MDIANECFTYLSVGLFAFLVPNVFGDFEIASLSLSAIEGRRSGIWILWGDIGDWGMALDIP